VFPFDIEEATFLAPEMDRIMTTNELIATRARALEKRTEDLERMKDMIIREYDFRPGSLVLVRNSSAESGLKNKYEPRYSLKWTGQYQSLGSPRSDYSRTT